MEDGRFAVSLIPHTQGKTTLHSVKVGDTVNLETDVIAKYVEKLLTQQASGDTDGNSDDKVTDNRKLEIYRSFMNHKV